MENTRYPIKAIPSAFDSIYLIISTTGEATIDWMKMEEKEEMQIGK